VTLNTTTAASTGALGGYASAIDVSSFTADVTGIVLDILPKNAFCVDGAHKGGICYRAGSSIYINTATADSYNVTCTVVYK